jgi:hypothetical protein
VSDPTILDKGSWYYRASEVLEPLIHRGLVANVADGDD